MNKIFSLVCGLLFGAGLAASGMTNTEKVIGFLDIFGVWDPDLLVVMAVAVITTVISFRIVLKRKTPLFELTFSLPTSTIIDKRLVLGASIFGIGWGLYGYCPGPAITALVYLDVNTYGFVVFMLLGMGLANAIDQH